MTSTEVDMNTVADDLLLYGNAFEKDGKRVDPRDVHIVDERYVGQVSPDVAKLIDIAALKPQDSGSLPRG